MIVAARRSSACCCPSATAQKPHGLTAGNTRAQRRRGRPCGSSRAPPSRPRPAGRAEPGSLPAHSCPAYLDVVLNLLVPLLGGGELSVGEGLPEALLGEERLQLQEGGRLAVLGDELPVVCEEVDWEGNEKQPVPCCGCPVGSPARSARRRQHSSPPGEPSASPPSHLSWGSQGSSSPPLCLLPEGPRGQGHQQGWVLPFSLLT